MAPKEVLTIQLGQSRPEIIALLQHSFAAALDVGVELRGEFAHAAAEVVKVEVNGRQLGERAVAVGECVCCILMELRGAEVGLRGAKIRCARCCSHAGSF